MEWSMLLAVCDDGAGNTRIDARYMLEEGGGSRVDLDTGEVDTGYHYAIKHGSQLFLIYVMLVQAYADGFRVDLHQFGQGILQAPRDRDSPALCSIKIGEFCTRGLGSRIDRSTSLVDDDVAKLPAAAFLLLELANQARDQLLGFTRSSTIAYDDDVNVMLCEQPAQYLLRFFGLVEVHGIRCDVFAGFIDDGQLAACAVARVNAQYFAAAQGRLQQQVTQIRSEDVDGVFFSLPGKFCAHFTFHCRRQKTFIAVFHSRGELPGEGRGSFNEVVAGNIWFCLHVIQRDANAQHFLPLGAVEGEHAMGYKFRDALVEVVVELVETVWIFLGDFLGVNRPGGNG